MKQILDEKDIPGASINGRDPSTLKVPELKRWLQCRNASTRGKKGDLVARYKCILLIMLLHVYNCL
jgi:hypothetical protein